MPCLDEVTNMRVGKKKRRGGLTASWETPTLRGWVMRGDQHLELRRVIARKRKEHQVSSVFS